MQKKITSKPYDNMFILLFNQNNLIIGALKRKYYKCPFPCWLIKKYSHTTWAKVSVLKRSPGFSKSEVLKAVLSLRSPELTVTALNTEPFEIGWKRQVTRERTSSKLLGKMKAFFQHLVARQPWKFHCSSKITWGHSPEKLKLKKSLLKGWCCE